MRLDKLSTNGACGPYPLRPFVLSLSKDVNWASHSRMTFWAYLLRCADGSYYAGHTDHLDIRVGQHLAGRGSDYTARRQPVMLVWSQDFETRIEALEAERRIKGWSRAKKEALIAGDWARLSLLARPSTSSGRTGE